MRYYLVSASFKAKNENLGIPDFIHSDIVLARDSSSAMVKFKKKHGVHYSLYDNVLESIHEWDKSKVVV